MHDAEQKFLLLLRERSRGLVHDDDARAGAQRAGNLHELLLGHRKRTHFGFRLNGRTDALQQFAGLREAF